MKKLALLTAAGALVLAALYVVFLQTPSGPRSIRVFDPDRVAELETGMWRAYYGKSKPELFRLLVTLHREQYRFTWARAVQVSYHLASAASTFSAIRANYAQVLPHLERAYAIERDWLGAGFDPQAVARAELAWWVARRQAGENSAEQIGQRIAEEYALFYEVPAERVARDEGGANADWETVARILRESFRELHAAVGG